MTNANESDQSRISAVYAAERQMGSTLHQSTLLTWVALLTYFGVASNFIFPIGKAETALLWLAPLPAWAAFAYYVLQFGMVVAHGRSIAVLEAALMHDTSVWPRYVAGEVGARAEESITNVNFQPPGLWVSKRNPVRAFMSIMSFISYGTAMSLVVLVAVLCGLGVVDKNNIWSWPSVSFVILNSILLFAVVGGFVSLLPLLGRDDKQTFPRD